MVAAVPVEDEGKFPAVIRQSHGGPVGEKKGKRRGGIEDFPVVVIVGDPADKRSFFGCDVEMLPGKDEEASFWEETRLL